MDGAHRFFFFFFILAEGRARRGLGVDEHALGLERCSGVGPCARGLQAQSMSVLDELAWVMRMCVVGAVARSDPPPITERMGRPGGRFTEEQAACLVRYCECA